MNSFKSFITLASIYIPQLLDSFVHLMWPCFPHSMHLKYFILFSVGFVHTLRHRFSRCPTWPHFLHTTTFVSVQSFAWCPTLLHLKHIFSVQSNESWVSLPQSIQFCRLVSFGHSLAIWPNYLQLWHLMVGLSSAQYLYCLHFFIIWSNCSFSKASILS